MDGMGVISELQIEMEYLLFHPRPLSTKETHHVTCLAPTYYIPST